MLINPNVQSLELSVLLFPPLSFSVGPSPLALFLLSASYKVVHNLNNCFYVYVYMPAKNRSVTTPYLNQGAHLYYEILTPNYAVL